MAGPELTDVQAPDNDHLDGQSCVGYAQDRAREYAAAVHFIGLLAGVVGSPEDIASARQTVRNALAGIGFSADDAELRRISLEKAAEWKRLSDMRTSSMSMEERALHQARIDAAMEAWNDAAKPLAEKWGPAGVADQIGDFFSSLWSSLRDTYHRAIASIANGTWKHAICRLGIDAGFALLETGVAAALASIGLGAAAAFLKIVTRVASASAPMVRVSVRATRNVVRDGPVDPGRATAESDFPRPINTETELTDAEKRILGEENEGNSEGSPTHDEGEAETRGDEAGREDEEERDRRDEEEDEPEPPEPDRPRTRDQLLVDGEVPSGADFAPWWDDLSPEEHRTLWSDKAIRSDIRAEVLGRGGTHEWLKRSQLQKFKELGFSMNEIKAFTSPTKATEGPDPENPGERWRHNPEGGGRGAGPGSGRMHRSLDRIIEDATSRNDLLRRYGYWANAWLDDGIDSFPAPMRDAIIQAGGG